MLRRGLTMRRPGGSGTMEQNSAFNTLFKLLFVVAMLLVSGFALEMFGYSTPATSWISDYFLSH
jgi:hypothetical protein